MKTITVINGQTLTDIAIQWYGCLEGVVQLATDNNLITAFNQVLKPGTKLLIQDSTPVFNNQNVNIASSFAVNGWQVSSGAAGPVPNGRYIVTSAGLNILTSQGESIEITTG